MSRHTTYRGINIDMDALRRENEKTVAVGNMRVNARGDKLEKGKIAKTADEIARENHRVQSAVVNNASLKGSQPVAPGILDSKQEPKKATPTATAPKAPKPVREKELPSGDIVIEDSDD